MSESNREFQGSLLRALLPPALTLFLVPVLSLGVASWGLHTQNEAYLAAIQQSVAGDTTVTAEQRDEMKRFYEAFPPASMCSNTMPEAAEYRQAVCGTGSELWQFFWVRRASVLALLLGLGGMLGALGLALLAGRSRSTQYWSFVAGSRMLRALAVLEIVTQGSLLVWCSFWITALLFNIYVPKLIFLVALLALAAMWTAIRGIFRGMPGPQAIEGVPVSESEAPTLWARIREIAGKLGTQPPRWVVAGIDDNFFVTETSLHLVGAGRTVPQELTGRSLYVSLPLLRILEREEAEGVLGHELAHFSGGDTAASARLGPELVRFDVYLDALAQDLLTRPAFYLLYLFRVVFELALARSRRERELIADKTAAGLTSPMALARALLKISAYSSYRRTTEDSLFAHARVHEGQLGLAGRVAAGLGTYATSAHFKNALAHANVPHPFDSHPIVSERFANLGVSVPEQDYEGLLREPPQQSWADAVTTAADIEGKLWAETEARFARAHELSLAYRYGPDTEEERALVLRHFPSVDFPAGTGTARISIEGLTAPGGKHVPWDDITRASLEEGNFSSALVIGVQGEADVKIDLKALKQQAQPFQQTFAHYWQRHQVMRKLKANPMRPDLDPTAAAPAPGPNAAQETPPAEG